ncbi:MAG: 16S rRNA (cytosine(1402)-N(4))-methyltransferase RsmH [Candidatus Anammoxibacter sp.]
MTDTHDYSHTPVMVDEVNELLNLSPGKVIVDCTVGGGGHTREILKRIIPGGFLIGIDKDEDVLKETNNALLLNSQFSSDVNNEQSISGQARDNFAFYHADYKDLDEVLNRAGKGRVDGVLLDLGVSSIQLERPERGFSFAKEGPLDMRMDKLSNVTAYDVLSRISLKELEHIIRKFGEEPRARRIAMAIMQRRREIGCVKTTSDLVDVIKKAVPFSRKKIHPATLTFQALRIVVNKELEHLESLLNRIHLFLKEGGRVVVISFHSLEDRIVKNIFRDGSKQGIIKVLTPKPLRPLESEVRLNPRSRSAKLRASERI